MDSSGERRKTTEPLPASGGRYIMPIRDIDPVMPVNIGSPMLAIEPIEPIEPMPEGMSDELVPGMVPGIVIDENVVPELLKPTPSPFMEFRSLLPPEDIVIPPEDMVIPPDSLD